MKGHKILKLGQKWLYHDEKNELCTGTIIKIDLVSKIIVIKDQYTDDEYLRAMPDLPVLIEYQKTGEKECDANVYNVIKGGNKIGQLYRAYYPSRGRALRRYVGHWDGGYEWKFDVEEWAYERGYIRGGMYSFESIKKAKEFIADETKYKELP